jgi:hypothetical protein
VNRASSFTEKIQLLEQNHGFQKPLTLEDSRKVGVTDYFIRRVSFFWKAQLTA